VLRENLSFEKERPSRASQRKLLLDIAGLLLISLNASATKDIYSSIN